jgi:hypothetical protein
MTPLTSNLLEHPLAFGAESSITRLLTSTSAATSPVQIFAGPIEAILNFVNAGCTFAG